ncbi:MAG: EAL domain-containing protein [Thermodesulfovibrionales bacterium]|nr:EAL domain-containing protein [Thermodesulfovibrionales bacterium]
MSKIQNDLKVIPDDTVLLSKDGRVLYISQSLFDFFQERCVDIPDYDDLTGFYYISLWENILSNIDSKRQILDDIGKLLSREIKSLVIEISGCEGKGSVNLFLHNLKIPKLKGYNLIQHIDISKFLGSKQTVKPNLSSLHLNEQEIFKLAYQDPVTDLPNRFLLIDRLNQIIARSRRYRSKFAIMFVDIDNFKKINESLGHEAGDIMLKETSRRLKDAVRDSDIVSRFGGDEFAIVIHDLEKLESTVTVAQRIIKSISTPFKIKGQDIYVTASVGIATFPDDGDSSDLLLKNTETAMFYAKSLDKNNYQFFNKTMNQFALERLKIENDIRRAIENDEFVLHYQPQIEISTGKIVGVEALIRWLHPTKGSISPLKFIPIAEETGLIIQISEIVFKKATEQLSEWIQSGINPGVLAVNISFKHFKQHNFSDFIIYQVDRSRIEPSQIELELTESILMHDVQSVVKTLKRFRDKGIHISIDDFGTGYSSLNYLKNLPISKLKIDRTFVNNITTDKKDAMIVKTIIEIAHNLELKVIAEGVENIEQMRFLGDLRCDELQGFLFSKPLPAHEFKRLFEAMSLLSR